MFWAAKLFGFSLFYDLIQIVGRFILIFRLGVNNIEFKSELTQWPVTALSFVAGRDVNAFSKSHNR